MAAAASLVKGIKNVKELEDIIKGDKLVLCDFFATWCGPCRMIAPIFEQLAKENTNIIFVKVDVGEVEDIMHKYEIDSVPTFILFRKGEKVGSVFGADVDKLKALIADKK